MEITAAQLEAENERLRNALTNIKQHLDAAVKAYDDISCLLEEREEGTVTDEDVKSLLRKYNSL